MAKRTKDQRKASAIGAVLAIVALVVAFATVAVIDARGGSVIDSSGEIKSATPILFSVTDGSDVVKAGLVKFGPCEPSSDIPLVHDFINGTATKGVGLNYTTVPLQSCGGAGGLNSYYVITTLTGQDVIDLDAVAWGISWESVDVNATEVLTGGLYLVPPPGTGDPLNNVAISAANIKNNDTNYGAFGAVDLAVFDILSNWYIGFGVEGEEGTDVVPNLGDQMIVDLTLYSANVTGFQASKASVFDIVPPAALLSFAMWMVALLGFFATIWIWPSTNIKSAPGFSSKKKGGRK